MFSHVRVYWEFPEISYSVRCVTSADRALAFQTELRRQLPKPYIISHGEFTLTLVSLVGRADDASAPQPLYFLESWAPKGGYKTVHAAVGSGIDFYNVQYYNQGTSYPYTDCAVSFPIMCSHHLR